MNSEGTTIEALDRLMHIGFRHTGFWELIGKQIKFVPVDAPQTNNILYAFVIDGSPVYVGKTIKTLGKRMHFYAKPGPKQSTNVKNNLLIRQALEEGRAALRAVRLVCSCRRALPSRCD